MGQTLTRSVIGGCLWLAASLLATTASAQTGGGEGLSPTLSAIKRTHTVRLGYRESSPPFSFLDLSGRPIGYSLELCAAIVEQIASETDEPDLKIEYIRVTTESRIADVIQGRVDFECGSTTANAE